MFSGLGEFVQWGRVKGRDRHPRRRRRVVLAGLRVRDHLPLPRTMNLRIRSRILHPWHLEIAPDIRILVQGNPWSGRGARTLHLPCAGVVLVRLHAGWC